MRNLSVSSIRLFLACVLVLTLPACHKKQTSSQYSNHDRALAAGAVAGSYLVKNPERSIESFKQATQLEPDNREWKSMLAFAYYKAKRKAEAIPIWQELAKGNDDIAAQSKRWLNKAGA